MNAHINPDAMRAIRTAEEAWLFSLLVGMPLVVIEGSRDDLREPGMLVTGRFTLLEVCETMLSHSNRVWIGVPAEKNGFHRE